MQIKNRNMLNQKTSFGMNFTPKTMEGIDRANASMGFSPWRVDGFATLMEDSSTKDLLVNVLNLDPKDSFRPPLTIEIAHAATPNRWHIFKNLGGQGTDIQQRATKVLSVSADSGFLRNAKNILKI